MAADEVLLNGLVLALKDQVSHGCLRTFLCVDVFETLVSQELAYESRTCAKVEHLGVGILEFSIERLFNIE